MSEERLRIYIESTIPSYMVARPARDLFQASRQESTREWWHEKRHEYELFTSQIVLDEIGAGEPEMAKQRLQLMSGITLLQSNLRSEHLTDKILQSAILPSKASRDAGHISIATVYKMDVLLTLNCTHIANPHIQVRLKRLFQAVGFVMPIIATPSEVLGRGCETI